jgi:hypothetical protein
MNNIERTAKGNGHIANDFIHFKLIQYRQEFVNSTKWQSNLANPNCYEF